MRIFLLTVLLASFLAGMMAWKVPTLAAKPGQNRVIVVLDNLLIRDTHALFFKDLEVQGFQLDFKLVSHDSIKLQEYGEYLYDHMILFCTSESDPKNLKMEKILEFYDSGHNVIIAGDVDTSKYFRSLVTNFGVDFHPFGSRVYDHVNKANVLDHGLFYTNNIVNSRAFTDLTDKSKVLYRGIGMSLTPYENYQVWGVLRGTEYTYSRSDIGGTLRTIGTGNNVVLVSALQGRNNARAIISGSLDLFSNELFMESKEANRQFAYDLAQWTFQLRAVLKVENIRHHFANDPSYQPHEYKVYDDLVYNVDITEYNPISGKWEPYVANDLQLEFVMLDPYVRMPLSHVAGTSTYRAAFRAPDRYGVFQFKVNYRRPGYTFLNLATKITVRPFKHNEYERYLFDAYPYYATVFATLLGFYAFVAFFLYDKESRAGEKAKKE